MSDIYLRRGPSSFTLTEQEAYAAMELFLAQFQSRGGNDLHLFRGMIDTEPDGNATDPAQWHDWLNCLRAIKGLPADAASDTWARLGNPPTVHRL